MNSDLRTGDLGNPPVLKPDLRLIGSLHRFDREDGILVIRRVDEAVAVDPTVRIHAIDPIFRH